MFKAGEVSLGGQTLAVQIEKAVVPVSQEDTTSDVKTVVEILVRGMHYTLMHMRISQLPRLRTAFKV